MESAQEEGAVAEAGVRKSQTPLGGDRGNLSDPEWIMEGVSRWRSGRVRFAF